MDVCEQFNAQFKALTDHKRFLPNTFLDISHDLLRGLSQDALKKAPLDCLELIPGKTPDHIATKIHAVYDSAVELLKEERQTTQDSSGTHYPSAKLWTELQRQGTSFSIDHVTRSKDPKEECDTLDTFSARRGSVHHVYFDEETGTWTCTCPHSMRLGMCKHILVSKHKQHNASISSTSSSSSSNQLQLQLKCLTPLFCILCSS